MTSQFRGGLLAALEKRCPAPEWALFAEVRNSTGYVRQARSADAIAMALWPSRGLEIHGFEIKTSRSDWLREKKDPAKAEEMATFCDRWWIVAGDSTIVKAGELPPSWGLLVYDGKSTVRSKQDAPLLREGPVADRPMPRHFVAALLRRAHEQMTSSDALREAERKGHKAGLAEGRKKSDAATELLILEQKIRARDMTIENYEKGLKASGFENFRSWDIPRAGEIVEMLSKHDSPDHLIARVETFSNGLKQGLASLTKATKEFQAK